MADVSYHHGGGAGDAGDGNRRGNGRDAGKKYHPFLKEVDKGSPWERSKALLDDFGQMFKKMEERRQTLLGEINTWEHRWRSEGARDGREVMAELVHQRAEVSDQYAQAYNALHPHYEQLTKQLGRVETRNLGRRRYENLLGKKYDQEMEPAVATWEALMPEYKRTADAQRTQ